MFVLPLLFLLPLDGHRIEAFRNREFRPLATAVQSLDGHRVAAVARTGKAIVSVPVRAAKAFRNRERKPFINGVKSLGRGLAAIRPRGCRGGR